jgi:predicted NUDIX family NTP pyrophosphohydrolase
LAPATSTVVSGSITTAVRLAFGSETNTSVPAGASMSSSSTVNVAWPPTTRYSSSCPELSSCSWITVAPASRAVHALTPKAWIPKLRRIGAQPSASASSAIVAVSWLFIRRDP